MAIEVIGAGLGRTGTMSLKFALERMGLGPCFHMVELMKVPERLKYLKQAHKTGDSDWDALFHGFSSAVDYPICLYLQPLLQKYPDAKVVLTLRDPDVWYTSVTNTIWHAAPHSASDILKLIWGTIRHKDMRKVAPVFNHSDQLIWKEQFEGRFRDKDFAIAKYHEHTEWVRSIVPEGQLLEYNLGDGWVPLCEFLDKEILKEEFPKSNDQAEFQRKLKRLQTEGVFAA